LADAALNNPEAHLYGPVLGLPALREEIASQWSKAYGGRSPRAGRDHPRLQSGLHRVMATLAGPGDEVILPTPWYFNHKMWLDMTVGQNRAAGYRPTLIPDGRSGCGAHHPRTRAIVLVTPNNPGGVEYPAETLTAFRDLARARGIALIVDETYRDFDSRHRCAA
jgi:aspartate/methionine/tyrosine aminotransferase